MKYDVFISSKSEDYPLAQQVYDFLVANGLKVFLACKELDRLGEAEYGQKIDEAIDNTTHMVLVSSSLTHVNAKWVRYEWSTFSNDLKSGYRTGNLVTILKDIALRELPASLRHQQSFTINDYKEHILSFLNHDLTDDTNIIRSSRHGEVSKIRIVLPFIVLFVVVYILYRLFIIPTPIDPIETISMVDLGLPSGTLWLDRNIGASSISDPGYFFAWGEIKNKDKFNRGNYNQIDLTSISGNIEYDPASYYNHQWMMPTVNQIEELVNNCKWTWSKTNGVSGYLIKGPSGKSIFLPVTGWKTDDRSEDTSEFGYYWTGTNMTKELANQLSFSRLKPNVSKGYKYYGRCVRPVVKNGNAQPGVLPAAE